MFSVFIADDPYHMGECIFRMRIFTIQLLDTGCQADQADIGELWVHAVSVAC